MISPIPLFRPRALPRLPALALAAALLGAALPAAAEDIGRSRGQTLYLPIYSHLWHGNRDKAGNPEMSLLSALVSIRNTDPRTPIRVTSARYYDTAGRLIQEYLAAPRVIPPLGTLELFVERKETAGGSGANFLIRWQSEGNGTANAPLVEAVHVDMYGTRAISFTTNARAIQD
ncbi:DUF3124 domain-containing protein [Azospira inquinata]|uniref:DUF3124 domain-containing protein n=1 Tax=Azospira inquinata TaxID=2785627 RepID=A0A975SNZ4_9RHOO|nr:DUF3124 domain-containing protein [Azospira inquinata]QWT45343.1 DUF3124 domain-containing protein [Azospira inquinata]QWT49325.1 DUF3124 domain-containing protein [Azospira inquinata]